MIDAMWERWSEQNAGIEVEEARCGDDFVELLCLYLRRADAQVTIDPGRNYTLACTFCGTSKEPRELVVLGTYQNGSSLERPVCARCRPMADMKRLRPVASILREGWPGKRLDLPPK